MTSLSSYRKSAPNRSGEAIVPNAIIAGAPKCGTTSLFAYLSDHPSVCPSNVKETYYLMDPDYPFYRAEANVLSGGLSGYANYFSPAPNTPYSIYLEATPDYLYQRTPLKLLPQLPTIPAIIILLRRPSERIYSLYRFAQNNVGVLPKGIGFAEYVRWVRRGDSRLAHDHILSKSIDHSRYSYYLKRWASSVGRDNIHVVLFEDMVSDPRKTLSRLAAALRIDPSYYADYDFRPRNESLVIRRPWLHRVKQQFSQRAPNLGALRRIAAELYRRVNVVPRAPGRSASDLATLADLDRELADSARELRDIFGVDLSGWNQT